MRVPTIDERLSRFLSDPRQDHWSLVREQLISQDDFDPYSPEWRRLEDAFGAADFDRVLELSEQLGRWGGLSPRFHFLTGVAALETADRVRARRERQFTEACLEAILGSGEGTEAEPFLSTYPTDCYDVLRALDLDAKSQQLVDRGGFWCDVITVDDGDEYWFDVTDLLEFRSRRAAPWGNQAAAPVPGWPA